MNLVFSCSGSDSNNENGPDDKPLGMPIPVTKMIFSEKDLTQKLYAGDSILLTSKNPFNIWDLQYSDFVNYYIPRGNYSAFEFQKMKLDWLTMIHPTDSTLILKVDSSVGNKPITIYTKLIAPVKTDDGRPIEFDNYIITVTREPIKGK